MPFYIKKLREYYKKYNVKFFYTPHTLRNPILEKTKKNMNNGMEIIWRITWQNVQVKN